jgi:hypothetical protein
MRLRWPCLVGTLLWPLALQAEQPAESYTNAQALDELRCLKSWEQLCATSESAYPEMKVSASRVVFFPYMDLTEVAFDVVNRRGSNLRLRLRSDHGDRPSARLTLSKDYATYVGPDPRDGTTRIELLLVKSAVLSARRNALVKRFVPGGVCSNRTSWHDDGQARPCLNAKVSSSR